MVGPNVAISVEKDETVKICRMKNRQDIVTRGWK